MGIRRIGGARVHGAATTTRSGLMPRTVAGATYLGETSVDSTGDFAATFAVPFSVSVGDHVLHINGLRKANAVRSLKWGWWWSQVPRRWSQARPNALDSSKGLIR